MDIKKNIFILTGAGISKESGIETFREKDGLWDNHHIEDVRAQNIAHGNRITA